MLELLRRLWELANEDRINASTVCESLALWKTLDATLEASTNDTVRVGDKAFVTFLACVRGFLSDTAPWLLVSEAHDAHSIVALVMRVLVRIGSQGERERGALVRDGVAELVVHAIDSQKQQQDVAAAAGALNSLQTLALDAANRHALDAAGAIPFTISLMSAHTDSAPVQLFGCKLLQLLAYEDNRREKIAQHQGLDVVLQALNTRRNDPQLAESALELIYVVSVSLPAASSATTTKRFQAQVEGILDCVSICLPLHASVAPIQSHGMGILSA